MKRPWVHIGMGKTCEPKEYVLKQPPTYVFQEHPLMWIEKSLQAIPHLHLSTSHCCYLQALELQWLRDQNRGREPDHRELLTPFLMRFPFLSFSFHGPLNFEFGSTIMLRELESSEPREPSRVHLCPLCRFQTLSGLCMTNTVSVYTGFFKKNTWCWPSWTGFSDQSPLFLGCWWAGLSVFSPSTQTALPG